VGLVAAYGPFAGVACTALDFSTRFLRVATSPPGLLTSRPGSSAPSRPGGSAVSSRSRPEKIGCAGASRAAFFHHGAAPSPPMPHITVEPATAKSPSLQWPRRRRRLGWLHCVDSWRCCRCWRASSHAGHERREGRRLFWSWVVLWRAPSLLGEGVPTLNTVDGRSAPPRQCLCSTPTRPSLRRVPVRRSEVHSALFWGRESTRRKRPD
jgi:hypothetical protein